MEFFECFLEITKVDTMIVNFLQEEVKNNTYHYSILVFNATFNNISVRSWWSVLLVKETRVPRENHQPVASH
jgi:hypothetical protein